MKQFTVKRLTIENFKLVYYINTFSIYFISDNVLFVNSCLKLRKIYIYTNFLNGFQKISWFEK